MNIHYFLTLMNIPGLSIHVLDTLNTLRSIRLIIEQVQRARMDSKNRECQLCDLSGRTARMLQCTPSITAVIKSSLDQLCLDI